MDSYNEIRELGSHPAGVDLRLWYRCQDNAADSVVAGDAALGSDATMQNGNTTASRTTVGPVSYLPAAFDFSTGGFPENVHPDADWDPGAGDFTYFQWFRDKDGSFANRKLIQRTAIDGSVFFMDMLVGGSIRARLERPGGGPSNALSVTSPSGLADTDWHSVAVTRNGLLITFYIDGVPVATGILNATGIWNFGPSTIGWDIGSSWLDELGDVSVHSVALSDPEVAQLHGGPELVNTVAPAAPAGSALVDTVHTAATGTWDLPAPFTGLANGTPSYSYQWYTATDAAGADAAVIAGATSSSFTPTSAQLGLHLGYLVTASNDGGTDPAAATFSAWMADPVASPIPSDGWTAQRAGVLFTSRSRRTVLWDNSKPGRAVLWG